MAEHTHHHQHESTPLIIPALETAEEMSKACVRFLETLSPDLRRKAEIPFDQGERLRWHFVPIDMFERKGVLIQEMNQEQRDVAFKLLATGLSEKGYQKATAIIDLEAILGDIERAQGTYSHPRGPELYFFTVFGDPDGSQPWGWRVEGHHVSLHFTIVNRKLISPNPSFFGSNPGEVKQGEHKGLRILSTEEDLARSLLKSLTPDQRSKTIINADAPHDILTRDNPRVEIQHAEGIAIESLSTAQRQMTMDLISEYVDRMPDQLAGIERKKLQHADLNAIHFAWAGGEERGQPHYYRLHGHSFFVEYDNVQNNANHIHSIWRHLDDDFGLDLLQYHHQNGHSQ